MKTLLRLYEITYQVGELALEDRTRDVKYFVTSDGLDEALAMLDSLIQGDYFIISTQLKAVVK